MFLTENLPVFNVEKDKEYHHYIDHQSIAAYQLKNMSVAELDEDWTLYEFFGSIYVINLPKEKERLKHSRMALKQVSVKDFVVFPAIKGSEQVEERVWKQMDANWSGYDLTTVEGQKAFDKHRQAETGCYLSHLKVLEIVKDRFEQAKELLKSAKKKSDEKGIKKAENRLRKYSSVLIIEDDNQFGIVNPDLVSASLSGVGTLFREAMKELPQNWEMLYFMAHPIRQGERFSNHLVRNRQCIYLNAYAVNYLMYDTLINYLSKIYNPNNTHLDPVDFAISLIQDSHQTFSVIPSIAFQAEGLSSITSNNYTTLRQTQP